MFVMWYHSYDMNKKEKVIKNVILTVLMIAVGVLFSLQLRSTRNAKIQQEEELDRQIEEYSLRLEKLQKDITDLETEYNNKNAEYQSLLEDLSESDSSFYEIIKTYHNNIDNMKETACLTDINGAGIEIELADSAVSGQEYTANTLVHDTNILSVVNQLKLAGAEAISVNDERIVAMSEFICVGPAVKINDTKVYAPFVIKAVGNQNLLKKAIESSSVMTNPNISISVKYELKDNVTVPAYNKAYRNNIDQLKNFEG